MRPLVGSMSRLIMRSVVVLPHPDGPTSTHTSPSGTSRLSSRTATCPLGNCLVTDSRRIARGPVRRRPGTVIGVVIGAYDGGTLVDWSWVTDHTTDIWQRVEEHLQLVGWSLLWGLVLALPLAILAHRYHALRGPALSVTGILYTIPSIAAFTLLLPYTGLAQTTAIIPLTAYTLLILVRNVLAGLDGVADDVLDAAQGMGYSPARRLVSVELPLAVPSIMAGLRIA